MNPTAQSGMHPDAESLTAFAEQLLPAAERDQILMHMATCRRCREVVFLAQHARRSERSTSARNQSGDREAAGTMVQRLEMDVDSGDSICGPHRGRRCAALSPCGAGDADDCKAVADRCS